MWHYVPQLEETQLIIATPWYDSKGPLTTYRALVDALQRAGIYEQVPMRRGFVKSPNDPLVRALLYEAKEVKEGFVHILKHPEGHNADRYSLVFAPITSQGAVPALRFSTLDDLKEFLAKDLHFRLDPIDEALGEMERSGTGSIYPVTLTARQFKKLGLA